MYTPLTAYRTGSHGADAESEPSPILVELSKKMHFYHFLQKEMSAVKTEAEKEAVLTILLKTKIEIRALEREWKQIQSLRQPSLPDPAEHTPFALQRLQ